MTDDERQTNGDGSDAEAERWRERMLAAIDQLERTRKEIMKGRVSTYDSVDLLREAREIQTRKHEQA